MEENGSGVLKQKYDGIDGIRAFACIGIVMMHVLSNGKYQVDGFVFDTLIPSFTNFVFLFMTVSGFGMCCGYYEKFINKEVDISQFYIKRYKKILPFFAFLCVIDIVMSPSIEAVYEVFANLTLCFGLIPNANITVIGVGWFLGVVFAFYLLFPFFVFLISTKKRAWISLILAFLMNYVCDAYFGVGRSSIAYCFVYFVLGGIVYLYRKGIHDIPAVKWISLIGLLLSVIFYFVFGGITPAMMAINAFALIYAMQVEKISVLNNPATKALGNISFEVYLCHMVIYRVAEKAHLLHLTGNNVSDYIISFVLIFAGACIFAFVFKKIIDELMRRASFVYCCDR